MFSDRFEGSAVHGANRQRLSFDRRLVPANEIKDDWAFVWDSALRYNIAYSLQSVHFGVLLVNEYNVYWTPEAMVFKNAILQVASVAEAVLQYDLMMVEDEPVVQEVLGKDWEWVDFKEIPLPGIELPLGQRAVTGLQRAVVRERLDRNTKMQVLIRASRKAGIVPADMAAELDGLRATRNRIHIKSLSDPECAHYTAGMANDALDLLERYRRVALAWTVGFRAPGATNMSNALHARAAEQVAPPVPADDDFPF